jgi:hypothetical protein
VDAKALEKLCKTLGERFEREGRFSLAS